MEEEHLQMFLFDFVQILSENSNDHCLTAMIGARAILLNMLQV